MYVKKKTIKEYECHNMSFFPGTIKVLHIMSRRPD